MDYSHLKTINDLLEYDGYPISCVQGYHTRIVKNSSGEFRTIRKEENRMAYMKTLYAGYVEELAVKAYIESEVS